MISERFEVTCSFDSDRHVGLVSPASLLLGLLVDWFVLLVLCVCSVYVVLRVSLNI